MIKKSKQSVSSTCTTSPSFKHSHPMRCDLHVKHAEKNSVLEDSLPITLSLPVPIFMMLYLVSQRFGMSMEMWLMLQLKALHNEFVSVFSLDVEAWEARRVREGLIFPLKINS